jgi:glycosyltransferase involved in cell wall biosynthesis
MRGVLKIRTVLGIKDNQYRGNILYLHAGAELYGADRILLSLCSGTKALGWNPLVILPNEGPLIKEFEQKQIEVMVLPFPVLRRKYFTLKGIIRYLYDLFSYSKKVKQIIFNSNIDLVHSNTLAVIPGALGANKAKVPHIWHVHEIIVRPKIIGNLLSKIAFRYSERVVAVSNAVRNHLKQEKNAHKSTVIYNGVDSELFNETIAKKPSSGIKEVDDGSLIFGMIGRVNSWKGQSYLLSVAEIVFKNVPNSHCLFVGGVFENDNQHLDHLLDSIKSKGLQDKVTVIDFQKNPENVHKYFDVFVLPSTEPDPLPTVVLEAMATGVPVVANAHGGALEMVENGKTGYLIEVGNKEKMAEKITSLLINNEERKQFGKASRKRLVEHFSLNTFYQNFSKLYENTINKEHLN